MGQTATDKLISPIVGKAVTTEFDLDARIDTLEAGVPASEVTYTPADGTKWPGADPTAASGALDTAASRLAVLAASLRNVTISAGAEAGNAIIFTLTSVDAEGTAINTLGGETVFAEAFTDESLSVAAIPANFTLTDGGSGTRTNVSGSVTKAKFQTTDDGTVQIRITDVSSLFSGTIYMKFTYHAPTNVILAQAPQIAFANFT